jgi:glutathione S-transferase
MVQYSEGPATAVEGSSPKTAAPVLWHLTVSHYNEKVRWAFDYKGIPHVRRTTIPGAHPRVAKKLWGGRTFPVVDFGDEVVGDSTDIIAAIEQRWPERPLYPDKPEAFTEALALEDYFDEELGPCTRLLAIQRLLPDRRLMFEAFAPQLRGRRRLVATAMYPLVRRRVKGDLGIDEASADEAWTRCEAACRPFAAALREGRYLVGDRFCVADLTLASLLSPIVAPEQYPYSQPQRDHPSFADLRRLLDGFGALRWTCQIYARHRPSSAETKYPARRADPTDSKHHEGR